MAVRIFNATCQRGRYASDILTAAVNKITLARYERGAVFQCAVNDVLIAFVYLPGRI